jgi:UDP-glucuronate decarboxylase
VRRRPDITLARKALDWEPRISLAEGLPRTIEYFDDLLQRHGRALLQRSP